MAPSHGPVVQNLLTIARLSEPEFEALLSGLSTGFLETRRSVVQAVKDALSAEKQAGASELAAMLMAFARISNDETEEETQENIADLLEGTESDLSEHERRTGLKRVLQIISCRDLVMAAQAAYVERNHERVVSGTEVGTDMRPLMSAEGVLKSVVLWHSLTVQYHSRSSETEPTEAFVVDYSDLLDLKNQIDEALKSREEIQRKMAESGVAVWSPYTPKNDGASDPNDR